MILRSSETAATDRTGDAEFFFVLFVFWWTIIGYSFIVLRVCSVEVCFCYAGIRGRLRWIRCDVAFIRFTVGVVWRNAL